MGKRKFELEPIKTGTVQVNFTCPEDLWEQVKRIAVEEDRTIGKQVVHIIREWLKTSALSSFPSDA